jgi:uncharacterized damage-inducible protein DinB
MKRLILPLALTLCAAPLAAQQPASAGDAGSVAATRALWSLMAGYVQRSAEQMPEADFSYRPVDGVRSFGQVVAHVAGSQYMFCAAATGDAARTEDVEHTRTTKAAILQAFRESMAYCERAYAQADAATAQPITLFGQPRTRFYALTMNAVHVSEHYGNLVTYMRMKGMVPPSSQPQGQ